MTDYIRRDTLIEDIDEAVKHRGMGEIIGQTLRRYILRQPAADVAEVVRCKDCKHKVRIDANGIVICSEEHGMYCPTENDFYSYGERRDDDVSD